MGRASASQTARRLVGALILAALACLTLGFFFKPEPPPRMVPPSPADLVRQKLHQIISLDVAEQPLEDVLTELERKHGLRIELDRYSLAQSGLSPARKVTLRLRDVRLGNAISLLLIPCKPDQARADYAIVGDTVRIMSDVAVHQLAVTRIYAVPPWLTAQPEFSEGELAGALDLADRQNVPGALVITCPQRLDDEVADLLGALARVAESPRAPPPKEQSPAEAAIARALAERTHGEFHQTAFCDVLAYLADLHDVNIVMDPARMAEANVEVDTPVTYRARGITLRAGLQHILHDLGLALLIEHDAIIITSKEVAETHLVPEVYAARDLMSQKVYSPVDDLRELIASHVCPTTWKDAGGPASLIAVPGGFFVNALAQTHEELPRFLAWLRRALDPFIADYDPFNRSPAELRVSQALDRNVSLDVNDSALREVIRSLSEQAGAPLVISQKKIEEANVTLDTPISKKLRDVPLRTALKAILSDLGLDFIVRDEVVLVTSKEEYDTYLTVGIYRYRPVGIEPHRLREMLTYYIRPDSWKDQGGPGTVDIFGDVLVIWTTRQVHEDCQELMATLAQLRDMPTDIATGKTVRPLNRSPVERRLYEALDRSVSLEVTKAPFKDVIASFSRQARVPLLISQYRISEANVELDTPVTNKLREMPLRAALESILHDLDLDYIVRDEAILITSKEEHDTYYTLGIYGCQPVGIEPRRLRSILTGYIRPDLWRDPKGPDTVRICDDFLFVETTRQVHEECEELLTALARVGSRPTDSASERADRERQQRDLLHQMDKRRPLSAPPLR